MRIARLFCLITDRGAVDGQSKVAAARSILLAIHAHLPPLSSSHRAQQHSVRLFIHAYGDALMVDGDDDGRWWVMVRVEYGSMRMLVMTMVDDGEGN